MTASLTIAICGKWCLYDGQFGGIPIYNRAVARGYAAIGHQAVLICPKWAPSLPDESLAAPGVRVLRFALPRVPSRLMRGHLGGLARFAENWLISRGVRSVLDRLIASGGVQAAEFAESSLEGFHSVGKIGIPHLLRCHTPLSLLRQYYGAGEFRPGTWAYRMESSIIRRAPVLTAPSEDLCRHLIFDFDVSEDKVNVVPNPVESDIYRPLEQVRSGDAPTVLHVGRLDSRKGGTVLGEAAPSILAQIPDARIVFAGEDRADASAASVSASILRGCPEQSRSRLVFAGEVDEERLVELYSEADVCAVPSTIYESFSYTAAQAMACGRPVVASCIGGIPEVVRDGETGLLVPPGDTRALADALVRLFKDPGLRHAMGAAGRERVTKLYAPDRVAAGNVELLGVGKAGAR